MLCRAGGGCKENSMGLGTVIDISATPVNSEQFIVIFLVFHDQ